PLFYFFTFKMKAELSRVRNGANLTFRRCPAIESAHALLKLFFNIVPNGLPQCDALIMSYLFLPSFFLVFLLPRVFAIEQLIHPVFSHLSILLDPSQMKAKSHDWHVSAGDTYIY